MTRDLGDAVHLAFLRTAVLGAGVAIHLTFLGRAIDLALLGDAVHLAYRFATATRGAAAHRDRLTGEWCTLRTHQRLAWFRRYVQVSVDVVAVHEDTVEHTVDERRILLPLLGYLVELERHQGDADLLIVVSEFLDRGSWLVLLPGVEEGRGQIQYFHVLGGICSDQLGGLGAHDVLGLLALGPFVHDDGPGFRIGAARRPNLGPGFDVVPGEAELPLGVQCVDAIAVPLSVVRVDTLHDIIPIRPYLAIGEEAMDRRQVQVVSGITTLNLDIRREGDLLLHTLSAGDRHYFVLLGAGRACARRAGSTRGGGRFVTGGLCCRESNVDFLELLGGETRDAQDFLCFCIVIIYRTGLGVSCVSQLVTGDAFDCTLGADVCRCPAGHRRTACQHAYGYCGGGDDCHHPAQVIALTGHATHLLSGAVEGLAGQLGVHDLLAQPYDGGRFGRHDGKEERNQVRLELGESVQGVPAEERDEDEDDGESREGQPFLPGPLVGIEDDPGTENDEDGHHCDAPDESAQASEEAGQIIPSPREHEVPEGGVVAREGDTSGGVDEQHDAVEGEHEPVLGTEHDNSPGVCGMGRLPRCWTGFVPLNRHKGRRMYGPDSLVRTYAVPSGEGTVFCITILRVLV